MHRHYTKLTYKTTTMLLIPHDKISFGTIYSLLLPSYINLQATHFESYQTTNLVPTQKYAQNKNYNIEHSKYICNSTNSKWMLKLTLLQQKCWYMAVSAMLLDRRNSVYNKIVMLELDKLQKMSNHISAHCTQTSYNCLFPSLKKVYFPPCIVHKLHWPEHEKCCLETFQLQILH